MQYYGTHLSENISRREPEGYLLCLNVPVARSGTQEYLPEELGLPLAEMEATGKPSGRTQFSSSGPEGVQGRRPQCGLRCDPTGKPSGRTQFSSSGPEGVQGATGKPPGLIPVQRPESEVFSPETIASFEGMPITDDHPPDGVTVDNIRLLQKGHAHNIRRGTGTESDLLLADLIITDPVLIDRILTGKREISCGYTYELHEENGQYIQRKIRGNHVAVVNAGRAGKRVSIKDHQPERSHFTMKKSLLKKLTLMARDGDPEAIEALAEAVEEIIEEPEAVIAAETGEPAAEAGPGTEPEETVTEDSDILAAILDRLDRLITLLAPAVSDEDPADPAGTLPEELAEVVEEALEAAGEPAAAGSETAPEEAAEIAAIMEEVLSGESLPEEAPAEASVVLEPDDPAADCDDPDSRCSADALRAALTAIRPALKSMSRAGRRKVCADIAARLNRQRAADSRRYAALLKARRPVSPRSGADLARRIMAKRNPNYHE